MDHKIYRCRLYQSHLTILFEGSNFYNCRNCIIPIIQDDDVDGAISQYQPFIKNGVIFTEEFYIIKNDKLYNIFLNIGRNSLIEYNITTVGEIKNFKDFMRINFSTLNIHSQQTKHLSVDKIINMIENLRIFD